MISEADRIPYTLYPHDFDAAAAQRALPRHQPARALHLVEAWPGTVATVDGDKADERPDVLFGYVLAVAGELPPDVVGVLFVLEPSEVAAVRAQQERRAGEPWAHGRIEQQQPDGWMPTWRELNLPPVRATMCRIVAAWPGAIRAESSVPAIVDTAYSVAGSYPSGVVGCPLMLHLDDCALRRGATGCHCCGRGCAGGRRERLGRRRDRPGAFHETRPAAPGSRPAVVGPSPGFAAVAAVSHAARRT